MTIKRRKYGTGFAYYVDGAKLPGVTTILKMLPHEAFADAAARTTAEYALDHWDELAEMSLSKRLRTLEKARWSKVHEAAVRGTEVHKLGERLAADETVVVPDALAGHVEAYRDWLDANGVAPVQGATELVVANRAIGYCGQADLVADLPDVLIGPELIPACRWLLDLKTTASGVWPESALQLCGYEHAEVFVHPDDPDDERPMSWLGIERCGVVWIKSDACELRPVDTGEDVWEFFQRLAWLHQRHEAMPAWIGTPAYAVGLAAAAN